ncbi:hypothetical protein [Pseudoalteromonas sp. NBT06-2]|nr:hypothetical protein [Pseudoalteromonas sp. NBT06-2]
MASARCEFRAELDRKKHYKNHATKQGLKLGVWLKKLADKDYMIED